MPSLNWADIVEILHDEAKQTCVELLESVGYTSTSWQEGEPGLAHVELSAEIWAQLSKVAVYLKGAFLNKTAEGEALTKLSDSHFDNQRGGSVAAQRRTSLACAAGSGPHTINLGALVLAHPDGPTYRNVDDGVTVYPVVLPSGGSLSGLVFEAEVAGSAANKAINTVTILQTTLAGVTVTSDAIERSGTDAEPDPTLQTRNTTKWALLTEFELIDDAVRNIALTAAGPAGGGAVTDAIVDSSNPRGAGTFDVYMAGELATASVGDIALAQAAIDARVMGSTATPPTCVVFGAPATPLSITGTVYFQGSYLETDLDLATQIALEDFIKLIPLGGYDFYPGPSNVVPINDVETVIRNVQLGGQDIRKTVVLTAPADLIVAAFGKVIPGTITLNYIRVSG
jgi:hypothetical protein